MAESSSASRPSDKAQRAKNWVFTLPNPACQIALDQIPYLQYGIYGEEVCPTTGTNHFQGYLQFSRRQRFSTVKEELGWAHIEPAHGTPEQNIRYCSKEGKTHEFGEPAERTPTSGVASGFDDMIGDIRAGASSQVLAEKYSRIFIHRSRGIADLQRALFKPELRRNITTYVFWGASGIGKTRWAYDHYPACEIYKLDTNANGSLWFDGYSCQKVLLIDDFSGWIPFRTLLNILDIYPYLCQIKGSSVYARWTTVVITSETPPDAWYANVPGDASQLTRRLTHVCHLGFDATLTLADEGME